MPILVLKDSKYEFDAAEFTAREAIAIEKATGLTWQQFIESALTDTTAKIALVWMVLRRNGQPDLQFHDVDFPLGDFDIEPDAEQIRAFEAAQAEVDPPKVDVDPDADLSVPGSGPAPSPTPKPSTGSRRRSSSTSPPATGTT